MTKEIGKEDNTSRRRFLTAVGGVSSVAIAGCTGAGDEADEAEGPADDSDPEDNDGEANDNGDDPEEEEGEGGEERVVIGEVVEGGNLAMVVQGSAVTEQLGQFQEADPGNVFLGVLLAVKNTSNDVQSFNGFFQTRVRDDEDYEYEQTFATTCRDFTSGQLVPGEVERGFITFEVPEDAEGLELLFDFSAFDPFGFDRVEVDLTREANEIADLTMDLQVDVHSIGDTVEAQDVGATLHDIQFDTELGQFAQADEDYEYAIVNISVENNTGEPLSTSSLLQMSMKDPDGFTYTPDIQGGAQLDQGYAEGTEIAPGDSRRGEIAYEIPQDADPLYWFFDFSLVDLMDGEKAFWQVR